MQHTVRAYRQGDVILANLDDLSLPKMVNPGLARKPVKGRLVLAEGEVTGHAHVMDPDCATIHKTTNGNILTVHKAQVIAGTIVHGKTVEMLADGTLRFKAKGGPIIRFAPEDFTNHKNGIKVERSYALLTHDEHDAIPLSEGRYRVEIQQVAETPKTVRSVVD